MSTTNPPAAPRTTLARLLHPHARKLGATPHSPPVGPSADLDRLVRLERRRWAEGSPELAQLVAEQSLWYRHTKEATLRPLQAIALAELAEVGGLLGAVGVGTGKTLVSLLAPRALGRHWGPQRPLLVTAASLVEKTELEARDYAKQWGVPRVRRARLGEALPPASVVPEHLPVASWEWLSTPQGGRWLVHYAPTVIVADEAHALRAGAASTRARRVLGYLGDSGARLVALSGTLAGQRLAHWAPMGALALGPLCPAPLDPSTVTEWDRALAEDIDPLERASAGALGEALGVGPVAALGELRAAWGARWAESRGVVAGGGGDCPASLDITVRNPGPGNHAPPAASIEAIVAGRWGAAPPADSPSDVAAVTKAAHLGYWLRWDWDRCEWGKADAGLRADWRAARARWAVACRAWLVRLTDDLSEPRPAWVRNGPAGPDSPQLLAEACERGQAPTRELAEAWADWARLRHLPPPPVECELIGKRFEEVARWVADSLERAAAERGADRAALVWAPNAQWGEHLARWLGCPWAGPGDAGPDYAAMGRPSVGPVVASLRAHGVGKNLQMFGHNLVVSPPSSAEVWEQLLGRTHRPGQQRDRVTAEVWTLCKPARRALDNAKSGASYVATTTGTTPKLVAATWVAPPLSDW